METLNMNSIYAIQPTPSDDSLSFEQVWSQAGDNGLAPGYTNLIPLQINGRLILVAYNKVVQQIDVFELVENAPWIQKVDAVIVLSRGPWDMMDTFILGNMLYLLTYRAQDGTFGFYQISNDLSVSPPYIFALPRNTPTEGFTTIASFTSLGGQYMLGYNLHDGTVANFSVTVTPSTMGGVPPLMALNLWYHHWAKNWMHFAFFQMGGANFFFKINLSPDPQNHDQMKVNNVNIDHIQDNPALGTVEVGSYLQSQLPEAAALDIVARIPWDHGEPYLLTYVAKSGVTMFYRIHTDCQGWTSVGESTAVNGASIIVPYRIGNTSYALFYGGGHQ